MRKEDYEGQFEYTLQLFQNKKREFQEWLGALMCPDYDWRTDFSDYEMYLLTFERYKSGISFLDKEIILLTELLGVSSI